MIPGTPFYGVKRSKTLVYNKSDLKQRLTDNVTTSESVFRQNPIYCRCCCVRKLRWVFPAVMPREQASPRPLAAERWVFSGVGDFALL